MGMSHLKVTNACGNILSGRRLPFFIKQSSVYSYWILQAFVHCTALMHELFQQKAMHSAAKGMTVGHCNSRIPSCIPGIRSETRSL